MSSSDSVPIAAPAGFVPQVSDLPYRGALALTVGVEQAPQRALLIACTAPGAATLKLADDSMLTVPVASGLAILPFAVKAVLASGTTATASYASLV